MGTARAERGGDPLLAVFNPNDCRVLRACLAVWARGNTAAVAAVTARLFEQRSVAEAARLCERDEKQVRRWVADFSEAVRAAVGTGGVSLDELRG